MRIMFYLDLKIVLKNLPILLAESFAQVLSNAEDFF